MTKRYYCFSKRKLVSFSLGQQCFLTSIFAEDFWPICLQKKEDCWVSLRLVFLKAAYQRKCGVNFLSLQWLCDSSMWFKYEDAKNLLAAGRWTKSTKTVNLNNRLTATRRYGFHFTIQKYEVLHIYLWYLLLWQFDVLRNEIKSLLTNF